MKFRQLQGDLIKIELFTLLVTSLTFGQAFATDNYTGHRWFSTSTDTCYDQYSLNLMNLSYTDIVSELDQARSSWNNLPSQFTINKVSSCNHWITSANYGNTGYLGVTYHAYDVFGYISDMDTEINRYYQFSTAGTCTTPPYTLDYLMRHEFGHWVEFADEYNTSEVTVMYGAYDCNKWNSIKSHDSSSVTTIYG